MPLPRPPAIVLLLPLLACAPGAGLPSLRADPGHEITIAQLTEQIAAAPEVAELYFQRAWNYRELPDYAAARQDFEQTLKLKPDFLPALRELARLDADEGRVPEAIVRLEKALASPAPDQAFHVPGCRSLLADLYLRAGRNAEALAAAEAGIRGREDLSLDLCLFRAEAQRRLGKHDERVRDLDAAARRVSSFVLKIAWLESLIDANRGDEALPLVERELETSRFQASWRIRRARVLLAKNREAEAREDLQAALTEIESRLRPDYPDVSLLCDRGVARALLGDQTAARQDLARARELKADAWMTRLLERLTEP